jgi:hypothetical protein
VAAKETFDVTIRNWGKPRSLSSQQFACLYRTDTLKLLQSIACAVQVISVVNCRPEVDISGQLPGCEVGIQATSVQELVCGSWPEIDIEKCDRDEIAGHHALGWIVGQGIKQVASKIGFG